MKVLSDEVVGALAEELKNLGHDKNLAIVVVHMMKTQKQACEMLEYLKREQPTDDQALYLKMEEIVGCVDFSKKGETLEYLDRLLSALKHRKIKTVFTLYPPMWNNYDGYRTYDADTELYILFDDDMCLVINYRFIDKLNIEYRPLLETEREAYEKTIIKDCFNTRNDIYDFRLNKVIRTETVELEYDVIETVSVKPVSYEYGKWIDNGIEYMQPTEETFDELRLHMKNGKTITICPACAEVDGYIMFWSEDTLEFIEEKG